MINKDKLLRILKDAYYSEEEGVLIYTKHLNSAIFWTGLDKDKVEKAKEILNDLAKDTMGHGSIVKSMINYIKESSKNAF